MKKILGVCLLASLVSTGCLGPFNSFNRLLNWNAEVTDIDAVNEVIFIGLWVIPVYPIFAVGDMLIFNTIGYWGSNPIEEADDFPRSWEK